MLKSSPKRCSRYLARCTWSPTSKGPTGPIWNSHCPGITSALMPAVTLHGCTCHRTCWLAEACRVLLHVIMRQVMSRSRHPLVEALWRLDSCSHMTCTPQDTWNYRNLEWCVESLKHIPACFCMTSSPTDVVLKQHDSSSVSHSAPAAVYMHSGLLVRHDLPALTLAI